MSMEAHGQLMWRHASSGEAREAAASPQDHWAALQEAWRPFAVACKALWWDCMALPADAADEKNFRGGKIFTNISTSSPASRDMRCITSVAPFQRNIPWSQHGPAQGCCR